MIKNSDGVWELAAPLCEEEFELPFGGLYSSNEGGMIEAMQNVTNEEEAFEFRSSLRSCASDEYSTAVNSYEMSNRGDELFKVGRAEEALKAYMDAIEADPDNLMTYIRLLAVYTGLERFEEAFGYVLAGRRASECDLDLDKSFVLQESMLYAKLGYIAVAAEKVKSIDMESLEKKAKKKKSKSEAQPLTSEDNLSKEDLVKLVDEIASRVKRKELDAEDFDNTVSRLFEPKPSDNASIAAFLMHHLKKHANKGALKDSFEKKMENTGIFKKLTSIPALKAVLRKADFRRWSLAECSLLMEFFDLVHSNFKEEDKTYTQLFSQSAFITFLVNFGEVLVLNDTLKFLAHGGTLLHFDIIASWLRFLLALTKKGATFPVKKDFFNQRPFNSVLWYSKLMYASATGFFGMDVEALNVRRILDKPRKCYVEACALFDYVLKEEWFMEEVSKSGTLNITTTLDLLDMTVHLNFHSRQEMLLQVSMEKMIAMANMQPDVGYSPKRTLVLYERLLACRSVTNYCRRRPGLWLHLSQRLKFLSRNMSTFAGDAPGDLQISLNMLIQLLETGNKSEINDVVRDDDFVKIMASSLVIIFGTKLDEPTEVLINVQNSIVQIIAGFGVVSAEVVKQMVASKRGNVFNYFLELKSHDASSAQCFCSLLKFATPSQLEPIVNHPKINAFLAQMLMHIYESSERSKEELANVCLCLMRTISVSPTLVSRDVLLEAVLFSYFEEPEKLVAKLCSLIRIPKRKPTIKVAVETDKADDLPILPICAAILLAALVKKDQTFRTALKQENSFYGKVSDDMKKLVAIASCWPAKPGKK